MKKTPKTIAKKKTADAPSPFNATALQWFHGLRVESQVFILNTIAQFKAWQLGRDKRLPIEVLLATPEQRRAARQMDRDSRTRARQMEQHAQKRVAIQRQLQALHNRAQRKAPWHLTPQQQRRREALYAKLNALDGVR